MIASNAIKRIAASGVAAMVLVWTAAPAQAQLHINLVDEGGVAGSPAEQGFRIAAGYWESVLTNNVTINIGVSFASFGDPRIIGGTDSASSEVAAQQVVEALYDGRTTALDNALVLPSLTAGRYDDPTFGKVHGIDMVRNAPDNLFGDGLGIDLTKSQFDNNVTRNNAILNVNTANLKAIGLGAGLTGNDATIQFSSDFAFDFNPYDGIAAGQMDFINVAIHEMGHALGFVSGVDVYDVYSENGPSFAPLIGMLTNYDDEAVGSALDLFRYSSDPNNAAPGADPVLDWSVGGDPYFSIDGGLTQFNGRSQFSTGQYSGDGNQASHWKNATDANGAGVCDGFAQIGIMDPNVCYGQMGVISATDLAAFDAMGWNVNFDVLANKGYTITTKDIFLAAVPEPMAWGMMLGGFGIAGGMMRRRRDRKAGTPILAA